MKQVNPMSFMEGRLQEGGFLGVRNEEKDLIGTAAWGNGEVQFAESIGARGRKGIENQEDATVCATTALQTADQAVKFFAQSYEEIGKAARANEKGAAQGSCAISTAITPDGKITVANAGDSQAVVYILDKATGEVQARQLNTLHKPDDEKEYARIKAAGGEVFTIGVPRVNGDLAVARAFGDSRLNDLISSSPEITTFDMKPYLNDRYEVTVEVSCDGLRERDYEKETVKTVQNHKEGNLAESFVRGVSEAGSGDNLSCFMVKVPTNLAQTDGMIFGVYDGHAGSAISKLAAEQISEKNRSLDLEKLRSAELPRGTEFRGEMKLDGQVVPLNAQQPAQAANQATIGRPRASSPVAQPAAQAQQQAQAVRPASPMQPVVQPPRTASPTQPAAQPQQPAQAARPVSPTAQPTAQPQQPAPAARQNLQYAALPPDERPQAEYVNIASGLNDAIRNVSEMNASFAFLPNGSSSSSEPKVMLTLKKTSENDYNADLRVAIVNDTLPPEFKAKVRPATGDNSVIVLEFFAKDVPESFGEKELSEVQNTIRDNLGRFERIKRNVELDYSGKRAAQLNELFKESMPTGGKFEVGSNANQIKIDVKNDREGYLKIFKNNLPNDFKAEIVDSNNLGMKSLIINRENFTELTEKESRDIAAQAKCNLLAIQIGSVFAKDLGDNIGFNSPTKTISSHHVMVKVNPSEKYKLDTLQEILPKDLNPTVRFSSDKSAAVLIIEERNVRKLSGNEITYLNEKSYKISHPEHLNAATFNFTDSGRIEQERQSPAQARPVPMVQQPVQARAPQLDPRLLQGGVIDPQTAAAFKQQQARMLFQGGAIPQEVTEAFKQQLQPEQAQDTSPRRGVLKRSSGDSTEIAERAAAERRAKEAQTNKGIA